MLPASRTTSGGIVAEKNSVWRCFGSAAITLRTSWMKPMSSMRSASSSTNTSRRSSRTRPWPIRSSRRPGVATRTSTPRASACTCCALADAAEDDGVAELEKAAVGGEAVADLGRQLARRRQHQRRGRPSARPGGCRSTGGAGSAARTPPSCRCRSGRSPAGRGRRGDGESPWPGSASAWCSSRRGRRAGSARSNRDRQRRSRDSRFLDGPAPLSGAGRFRPSRARPRQPLSTSEDSGSGGRLERRWPALRARERSDRYFH